MYSLYSDYKKFKNIVNNYKGEESLDLSNENFIAPTTMIPLLNFADKNNIKEFLVNPNTKDYVKRILNREETSTTIPYEKLPFSAKERSDKALSFNTAQKINSVYGGQYTLMYLFSELTNNIYNHTPFEEELASNGYTYAQEYPNEKKLDICIWMMESGFLEDSENLKLILKMIVMLSN